MRTYSTSMIHLGITYEWVSERASSKWENTTTVWLLSDKYTTVRIESQPNNQTISANLY